MLAEFIFYIIGVLLCGALYVDVTKDLFPNYKWSFKDNIVTIFTSLFSWLGIFVVLISKIMFKNKINQVK
jgi:hypothetical protein